jgi:nitrate reductase NapE component
MEPSQPPQPKIEAAPATEVTGTDQSEGQPTLPSPAERAKEARARRRRAIRQFLVVGFCLAALLCLGVVGAGFLFYNQATKPDLSSPAIVTQKYLSAYLLNRDDRGAAQYLCSDVSGLAEIRALRDDLDARQKTYGVTISASVDAIRETDRLDNTATVLVDLVLSTVLDGEPQRAVQHWQFNVRNQSGWRVCGAHHLTE